MTASRPQPSYRERVGIDPGRGRGYRPPAPWKPSMYTRLIPAPAQDEAAVSWDDTPCPLCGHEDADTVLEAPDPLPAGGSSGLVFAVVKCRRCGLAYTNPRPDPASIGAFYPADY